MADDWDDKRTTGAAMTDEPAAAASKAEAPVEKVEPQVRLAASNRAVSTLTIPNLGGLTIGKQWHVVSVEQLDEIIFAARENGMILDVQGGPE